MGTRWIPFRWRASPLLRSRSPARFPIPSGFRVEGGVLPCYREDGRGWSAGRRDGRWEATSGAARGYGRGPPARGMGARTPRAVRGVPRAFGSPMWGRAGTAGRAHPPREVGGRRYSQARWSATRGRALSPTLVTIASRRYARSLVDRSAAMAGERPYAARTARGARPLGGAVRRGLRWRADAHGRGVRDLLCRVCLTVGARGPWHSGSGLRMISWGCEDRMGPGAITLWRAGWWRGAGRPGASPSYGLRRDATSEAALVNGPRAARPPVGPSNPRSCAPDLGGGCPWFGSCGLVRLLLGARMACGRGRCGAP